jgi:tetratricopeptide (TPR) repeat protein
MAIKGSLKEASLPDVLQLLSMGLKTGCLSVTHRNNFGSIFFEKGRICYASIVNRRDRLGDILVKSGKLRQDQLDAAIAEQARDRDERLGDILVRQGVITREQLHEQVRVQIEEAVYFLFTWMQGTFNFEADVKPEQQDFLVSISPDALLLEGARRVDEWSLIEKKIPTFDIVFDLDRKRLTDSGAALTSEQEVVVRLVDGRRDVQQIAEESGLVEFEVGKALYGLVTAGFLHRVGTSRASEPKVAETRVEEHKNLGIAFYKTGMLDEAVREFRRVIDLRPGDEAARFYIALSLIRQSKWADAANAFHEAAAPRHAKGAVFHNLAYALERLGRFDEARAALQEAQKRGLQDDPRVRTSLGIVTLRLGDVAAADKLLTEARELFAPKTPSPSWYHSAALAAALQGSLERASQIHAEGIGAHPHAAVLFNNQSVVQERLGHAEDALAVIDRGVQEDPGMPQLHKNLGDAHYHAGRTAEALEAYQRAVKLLPGLGPDVYLKTGNILFKRMDRAEAIHAWERALELDPGNAIVRTNLDAARRLG